jgi:hypothetical protein
MARRPPAVVRAGLPVRPRPRQQFSIVPGLPLWVLADIHRVEATRLRPGDVGIAFRELERYSRIAHQYRAQWVLGCPCCVPQARETLDLALQALPPRSRAALRALIHPLDDGICRRTLSDPTSPPDWPWWMRRISGIYRC